MTDVILIALSSIKSNLKSRAVAAVGIGVVLICAAGLAITFSVFFISPEMQTASPDLTRVGMYLSLILFIVNLMGLGVGLNIYAFQSLTREKSKGIIQSLLATPLSEKSIWIGKGLAVFLPGLIVGEILTLIALLAINFIYLVPVTGFLITPWIAVSSFAAVPLMYFSLSLLVYLVGLTGKPSSGNVIAQIFLPGLMTLVINLVLRGVIDSGSWVFTVLNLGIALVLGLVCLGLQSRLTRDRIILST